MKREVLEIDFDILKECCDDLGIELIPAKSSEYITLIDENGREERIFPGQNIFNTVSEVFSVGMLYTIDESYYEPNICVTNTKIVEGSFEYKNQPQGLYAVNYNKYVGDIIPAA